jgi:predicted nucleotidyltransferase
VTTEPLRLRLLLQRLVDADVGFVLVGGLAVNAWGHLRGTRDVDVVPDPDAANLEKLDAVLREIDGKVEVGEKLLAASAIRTFLRTGDRTLVVTELGRVDILQGLPQIPPFAVLQKESVEIDMDGLAVKVCSLEHLLQMKRASDRPRDRDDLEVLEADQDGDATDRD